ncbi:alpha/beta fold hydrolase [Nocardioides guangzhouensis]|uniref:Alpha/beta fold hydrolase n=1 Tax=Nocardioides guangzhouensis TaxID=2497878 RepID=A0A4V1XYS6_9ACTN|nr:alpha/beta fold hydrolase [Nocardioides guangzhouensis]RYP84279.1 alpha/beta fold hydrolase [Nocardioides guangzhouensis]
MSASLPKSTIVRLTHGTRRWLFRTGEVLAPRLGGRAVRNLWFTIPPIASDTPLPPGGEPFAVTSLGAAVRGHVWGEGPVVYLVHGWGGRGSQLASFVAPLTAAGFRVVLFDAPAHGRSEHGPAGPGRTHGVEMGKALDEVAARFGPAHTVVAHSLGTMAAYLALRYGWLGTGRLVLLAPMVEASSLVDQFQLALGFGRRTRRAFERDAHDLVGLPLAEFDARVQAAHVDPVPTLVVHDRGDRQTSYADAARLVADLPLAELVSTEGLGHRRILHDPAVVARTVAFIRDDVETVAA